MCCQSLYKHFPTNQIQTILWELEPELRILKTNQTPYCINCFLDFYTKTLAMMGYQPIHDYQNKNHSYLVE